MAEINLLPWRAMIRSENAKRKKLLLLLFIASVVIEFVMHCVLSLVAHAYDTTISDLHNQLTELTSQTKQDMVSPTLSIVEKIHANQLTLIRFFCINRKKYRENFYII